MCSVCVCECACVSECGCASVSACVRERECVCVCVCSVKPTGWTGVHEQQVNIRTQQRVGTARVCRTRTRGHRQRFPAQCHQVSLSVQH